jgi:hypothetical protein
MYCICGKDQREVSRTTHVEKFGDGEALVNPLTQRPSLVSFVHAEASLYSVQLMMAINDSILLRFKVCQNPEEALST